MSRTMDAEERTRLLLQTYELTSENMPAMLRANTLKSEGRLEEAVVVYQQLISSLERQLVNYDALGAAEDPNSAIPGWSAAAALSPRPIAQTLVNTLLTMDDVFRALRRSPDADACHARAMELAHVYLGAAGEAEVLRSIAASLTARARFHEALEALYRARDFFRAAETPLQAVRVTLDVVDILQWLGDYERAERELNAAAVAAAALPPVGADAGPEGIQTQVQMQRIAAELLYYRGLVAKFLNKHDEAEQCFREVLAAYEPLGVGAAIEYQLASVMLRRGEAARALELTAPVERALRQPGMMRPKLGALLGVQAQALLRLNRPEEALHKVDEALRELDQYFDPDRRWDLEWRRGAALAALGRFDEALDAYLAAARTVSSLRRAPLGHRLDSLYLKDKLPVFEEGIALAVARGRAADAAALMD
jgi:tetratricopeptide (TPR) repeat protein